MGVMAIIRAILMSQAAELQGLRLDVELLLMGFPSWLFEK
jgi:hypothetical protein